MGEVIVRQGNVGDNFYIIASGEVSVRKMVTPTSPEELVATLKTGDYFGEQALLRDDVRQATCYANTKVITLNLNREDFITMMGSMEDLLAVSTGRTTPTTGAATAKAVGTNEDAKTLSETASASQITLSASASSASLPLSARVYRLEEFSLGRTLGCGAFGRVKVCKLLETGTSYAIKCQSKLQIVSHKLEQHITNEVNIMRMIDNHPFIIKLFTTLQDNKYIYFVTELLHGGELFTYLRDTKRIPEQSARFYASSVIVAFQALHLKSIAYRDLKPENIVMTSTGYVKLIDLGLAKQVLSRKTYTLCGTPDYLAPEIILNEGHDISVDYWALGVLIYEMVVGLPPFYAKDPIEVYEKILSGDVRIHSSLSTNLGDLIRKLLVIKPNKRLGTGKSSGIALIMKQKWFSSFDWVHLQDCTMAAPYIPVLSNLDDVSHFDHFDEVPDPVSSMEM
jgi:serine/threonine protein kinase